MGVIYWQNGALAVDGWWAAATCHAHACLVTWRGTGNLQPPAAHYDASYHDMARRPWHICWHISPTSAPRGGQGAGRDAYYWLSWRQRSAPPSSCGINLPTMKHAMCAWHLILPPLAYHLHTIAVLSVALIAIPYITFLYHGITSQWHE